MIVGRNAADNQKVVDELVANGGQAFQVAAEQLDSKGLKAVPLWRRRAPVN